MTVILHTRIDDLAKMAQRLDCYQRELLQIREPEALIEPTADKVTQKTPVRFGLI